jgi:hypothetical protein
MLEGTGLTYPRFCRCATCCDRARAWIKTLSEARWDLRTRYQSVTRPAPVKPLPVRKRVNSQFLYQYLVGASAPAPQAPKPAAPPSGSSPTVWDPLWWDADDANDIEVREKDSVGSCSVFLT